MLTKIDFDKLTVETWPDPIDQAMQYLSDISLVIEDHSKLFEKIANLDLSKDSNKSHKFTQQWVRHLLLFTDTMFEAVEAEERELENKSVSPPSNR